MRITNKMIAKNMLSTVQRNQQMMNEAQLNIATTKKVRRPSDDPAGILQIQQFKILISRNEQSLKNITQIRGFTTNSESALQAVSEQLERAKSIAIQGGSGTVSAEARQSLAKNIDLLIDNIIDQGNSRFKGRFVLAAPRRLEQSRLPDPAMSSLITATMRISKVISALTPRRHTTNLAQIFFHRQAALTFSVN